MRDGADIDRFVRDPSMLVELCREVIDQLDASSCAGVAEREPVWMVAVPLGRAARRGLVFHLARFVRNDRLDQPQDNLLARHAIGPG